MSIFSIVKIAMDSNFKRKSFDSQFWKIRAASHQCPVQGPLVEKRKGNQWPEEVANHVGDLPLGTPALERLTQQPIPFLQDSTGLPGERCAWSSAPSIQLGLLRALLHTATLKARIPAQNFLTSALGAGLNLNWSRA